MNVFLHIIGKLALMVATGVEVRNDLHGDTKNKKPDVWLRIGLTLAGSFVDSWLNDVMFIKSLVLSSAIFVAFFDYAINLTMKVDGVKRPVFTYISLKGFDAWPLWVAIKWQGRLAVRASCLVGALCFYYWHLLQQLWQ